MMAIQKRKGKSMDKSMLYDFVDCMVDDMTVMEMDFEEHKECPEIQSAYKQYQKLKAEVNKLVAILEEE